MPELVGLRCRALAVAIADDDKSGRARVLDEVDRRAFGVDRRIVIYGRAEVRDHPLIDGVLAVVALPVRQARAGDGGLETVGLGDGEHGHEAAVAPAGDAYALRIDGVFRLNGVHAFEDVTQVAVAEVLAVGFGEGLALAEAAARIGLQHEVAERGESGGAQSAAPAPARLRGRGGAAVDFDDQRIFLAGIEVLWLEQPALDAELVAFPGKRYGFAPCGLDAVVEVRELRDAGESRGHCRAGPGGIDLRGMVEGAGVKDEELLKIGRGQAVRHAAIADVARDAEHGRPGAYFAGPGAITLEVQRDQLVVSAGEFRYVQGIVAAPLDPGR